MRLLLATNQTNHSKTLYQILKKEKYSVDKADDGGTALTQALSVPYDIIILDWFLPALNGIDIVKELRLQGISTLIILFLTNRNTIKDRILALDTGADDYIIQPFIPEEFLAKLRALSRRRDKEYTSCILNAGGLTLDSSKCKVIRGQTIVKLSIKETLLLEILMRNYGHVVTKEHIFEKVWGNNSNNAYAHVDLYIFYLRKKIGASYIKTVRGIGYYFNK